MKRLLILHSGYEIIVDGEKMRSELSLAEIKSITFSILQHFKSFCEENNIRFYLSNGTLLGAVKYGGFIPWDDDIDVLVPREDYDRLIKLYTDNEKYRLFSSDRDPDFCFPFAKLCDMTTLKVEHNTDNGVPIGLDIDIFPLDSCTEHIKKRSVQIKSKLYFLGCILSKFISCRDKPFVKRCVINYCKHKGYKYFSTALSLLVKKESNIDGDRFCGCLLWPVYGVNEVFPSTVFEDTVEVEFEKVIFPAPIGYDKYLRSLYGQYEEDPPIEKQKTHHRFKAYSIV